jgi:Rieske Fe-S protein
LRLAKSRAGSRREPASTQFGRRKLLSLIVAGTAGVITVVTVGGISLARAPESTKSSQLEIDDHHGSTSTTPMKEQEGDRYEHGNRDDDGKWPHKKPTPSGSPTPKPTPSPQPTQPPTPTPQPTQPPTPTPTPTGKVIGSSSQATNTSVNFTNPADGQGSLLIHLPNGNFVACERACTHQGAWVNYDPASGQLVCPAHGAIFDPKNACSHVSGPGSGPLTNVAITINANGTITTA